MRDPSIENMIGGYEWTIEGTVSADTANSRQFKLEYHTDWFDKIDVIMDGSLIKTLDFRSDARA